MVHLFLQFVQIAVNFFYNAYKNFLLLHLTSVNSLTRSSKCVVFFITLLSKSNKHKALNLSSVIEVLR